MQQRKVRLVHLSDQSVDVLFTITQIAALNEVLELSAVETTVGVGQLERPQEVAGLFEVGTNGEDLVNKIFHAYDSVLAKVLLDELIIGQRDTLLVDLPISTFVDELTDRLEVWVAVGDVWVYDRKHFLSSLGQTDENAIVDLEKAEQLENLSWLGSNLVDTEQSLASI